MLVAVDKYKDTYVRLKNTYGRDLVKVSLRKMPVSAGIGIHCMKFEQNSTLRSNITTVLVSTFIAKLAITSFIPDNHRSSV